MTQQLPPPAEAFAAQLYRGHRTAPKAAEDGRATAALQGTRPGGDWDVATWMVMDGVLGRHIREKDMFFF